MYLQMKKAQLELSAQIFITFNLTQSCCGKVRSIVAHTASLQTKGQNQLSNKMKALNQATSSKLTKKV